jgi:hypothetical protein
MGGTPINDANTNRAPSHYQDAETMFPSPESPRPWAREKRQASVRPGVSEANKIVNMRLCGRPLFTLGRNFLRLAFWECLVAANTDSNLLATKAGGFLQPPTQCNYTVNP